MKIINTISKKIKYVSMLIEQLFIGRINRLQFIISFLIMFLTPLSVHITILNNTKFSLYIANINNPGEFYMILIPLLTCLFIFYSSFVRRLHDIGMPGWFTLVPILGQLLIFPAFFTPSENTENIYGDKPHFKKTLSSVIFATKSNPANKGEKWLVKILLIFANLFIVMILSFLLGFLTWSTPNGGTRFDILGKTESGSFSRYVKNGEMKIFCNSNTNDVNGTKSIDDLDEIINLVMKECNNKLDADIIYGTGEMNLLEGQFNNIKSLNESYLFVLSRKTNNKSEQKKSVFIYHYNKNNNHFDKIYKEDINAKYAIVFDKEDNFINFKDVNNDNITDWQIKIQKRNAGSIYYTYVYKYDKSFSKWVSIDENFNNSYFISDTGIYYNGLLIFGTETPSFEIIDYRYAKDSKNVYSQGKPLTYLDPKTFQILRQDYSQNYVKDHRGVYYSDDLIVDADPKTFEFINNIYSKDNKNVFRETKKIINADPKTFQIFFDPNNYLNWGKDNDFVYFQDKIIKEANVKYFKPINQVFGKDDAKLFYKNTTIEGVDLRSLKLINDNFLYLTDKHRVYVDVDEGTNPIVLGADPNTFLMINNFYSKDKLSVFYKNTKIEKADPETFKILYYKNNSLIYASDKNYVYKNNQIIPNEDPNIFKIPHDDLNEY